MKRLAYPLLLAFGLYLSTLYQPAYARAYAQRSEPPTKAALLYLAQSCTNRFDATEAARYLEEVYENEAGGFRQGLVEVRDFFRWIAALSRGTGSRGYPKAEGPLNCALAIQEFLYGPAHLKIVEDLRDLAQLYAYLDRFAHAEALLRRALAIREGALDRDDPNLAVSLVDLAHLYFVQRRLAEAEPLLERALAIREKALPPEHEDVALSVYYLAHIYYDQARYSEAEPFYERALALNKKAFGTDHPNLADISNKLGLLYGGRDRYADAERSFKRAITVNESAFGSTYPGIAENLNNLALLYFEQERYADAEPHFERALALSENERARVIEHTDVAEILENYARLLRATNRSKEAAKLEARAKRKRGTVIGR